MHVTCEFGISGASRLTCRCVRIFKCTNHLRVHCTCTMHPSLLLHTAPSRPCQGAHMYRVWCRWLKVHFHRRTTRQNSFFAPGACSWHPTGTVPPMDFKLVQYACDLRVWVQWLPPFDLQGREKIFGRPLRGGTCHVPRAAGRPATGTNVVPAFRCVHRCHPGPDRTSRWGAIPGNAWTHRQTDKHQPPNFFSPTHRRKSSFIKTCYAKALAPFILYDFGLEAGIAKHCLGPKS